MYTVHSSLFFHKIVDIERFALRAAILDECQIYLRAGDSLGVGPLLPRLSKPRRPPPRYV